MNHHLPGVCQGPRPPRTVPGASLELPYLLWTEPMGLSDHSPAWSPGPRLDPLFST